MIGGAKAANLAFKGFVNRVAEPRRTNATGFVASFTPDSNGITSSMTVDVNGQNVPVLAPAGLVNVYTGMPLQITNYGSASAARWQVAGTGGFAGSSGGSIGSTGVLTEVVAKTGYTVFSHGTSLVYDVAIDGTFIITRLDIFDDNEQIALSDINGYVEHMRIDGAAIQIIDPDGYTFYKYNVDRFVYVSPAGSAVSWKAGTVVNGLTDKGYIVVDNRHNAINSPRLSGVYWFDEPPDPPTTALECYRLGNLNGVADITDDNHFGFAVGDLSIPYGSYLLFDSFTGGTTLQNSDLVINDVLGDEVVRIYGKGSNDRLPGDYDFGKVISVHETLNTSEETWGVYRGATAQIEVTMDHTFIKDLLTIGDPAAARITLGEEDNRSVIALRNKHGAVKAVFSTDEDGEAFVHIGNAPPEANSISYDGATNIANVDAHVTMRSASVAGRLEFQSTGEFKIIDPDDSGRFGVTTPRGTYAYTTDGTGTTHLIRVDAWGPLVLEDVLGSGTWRTWVGGSQMFGDPRYRHFRIERGATARAGFFNGETPAVYLDVTGKAVFGNPASDNITIDTEGGIRLFNPTSGNTEGVGETLYEDHMLSVWESASDTLPIHRISAWKSTDATPVHTLFFQSQPPTGERARVLISALGDSQAQVVIRAVGGYDTANQQAPAITLTGYNAEGAGVYTHSRIELDADLTYLKARTAAGIPGGTIQNGHILHSNGTYDPGAGAGVYIYYGGYWVPVALAGDATGWEDITTTATAGNVRHYKCSDAGGSYTITLPAATSKPRNWTYTFKKSNSSGNTITIDADGAATIDGATTYVLTTQYQFVTIRRAGANWDIVAKG